MLYNNINGIATQTKKLYEYVNGTKQEIQERYEYVDGRKELVFKNKTIKRECFIDANGNPLNNFSGGQVNTSTKLYGRNEVFYSIKYFSNRLLSLNTFNLGNASGKRITKIEFYFDGNCRWTSTDTESSSSSWDKFRFLILDNNNTNIQTMEYTRFSKEATGDSGGHYYWENIQRTITLDKIMTSLKIQLQVYNTSLVNPHLYATNSNPGVIQLGFRNLYITYED